MASVRRVETENGLPGEGGRFLFPAVGGSGMDRCELGRRGEEEAVRYLRARGWAVLGRNVRAGHREVDVIAWRQGIIAFVEVKSRSGMGFGHPLEAITEGKRHDIARVARTWLRGRSLPPGTLIRFDAVSVEWSDRGRPRVIHIPDAWRLE